MSDWLGCLLSLSHLYPQPLSVFRSQSIFVVCVTLLYPHRCNKSYTTATRSHIIDYDCMMSVSPFAFLAFHTTPGTAHRLVV